jgi:hypothetical protein
MFFLMAARVKIALCSTHRADSLTALLDPRRGSIQ